LFFKFEVKGEYVMTLSTGLAKRTNRFFLSNEGCEYTFAELQHSLNIEHTEVSNLDDVLSLLEQRSYVNKLPGDIYTCNIKESYLEKKRSRSVGRPKMDLGNRETVLCVLSKKTHSYKPLIRSAKDKHLNILKGDRWQIEDFEDGCIVEVIPLKSNDQKTYKGAKLKKFVSNTVKGLESIISMHNYGIDPEFPPEVLDFVDQIEDTILQEEIDRRQDLRHLPLVTIDGKDTRDFDDAVWAEKWIDKNGKHIGYHIVSAISDVTHYIPKGSVLDIEAKKRANTVYFANGYVPMIPKKLSNGLCSLVPNEDRLAMAYHMYINLEGELVKYDVERAVIKSHKRLTYDQVQASIDGDFTGIIDETFYHDSILPLREAYKLLKKQRDARGALTINLSSYRIMIDINTGEVSGISERVRKESDKIIEEIMILTNIATALILKDHGCLYRVHQKPEERKVLEFLKALDMKGVSYCSNFDPRSPEGIQEIIESIDIRDDKDVILDAVPKMMSKACYSPEEIGHYALALSLYAHSTSPIRRYPDIINHRSVIYVKGLPGKGGYNYSHKELCESGRNISERERITDKAVQDSNDRLVAGFYSEKVSSVCKASVCSVNNREVIVRTDDSGIVGAFNSGDLVDLSYEFAGESKAYISEEKHLESVTIGSKVNVKVHGVDIAKGKVAFKYDSIYMQEVA